MSGTGRPLYGIDSGGSTTSVRASDGGGWDAPSCNPSSVGKDAAARCLSGVFERIRRHAACHAGRPAVWLACAALDPALPRDDVAWLVEQARSAGLRGDLVIYNDVTPLVLDVPAGAGHVVAVCGTGAAFVASDGVSPPCRVGGCEYLGSDEGSAFDLGLRGLRASVRGLDGRAERTALADLLASETGAPAIELARTLARAPFPKSAVAALAPLVLHAWRQGDAVAARLVTDAIGELALGVRAARDAAALRPGWRLSATGGVLAGSPEFLGELAAAATRLGAASVRLITDPAMAVLATLTRLCRAQDSADVVRLLDRRIGRDVRHVDLGDPGRTVR